MLTGEPVEDVEGTLDGSDGVARQPIGPHTSLRQNLSLVRHGGAPPRQTQPQFEVLPPTQRLIEEAKRHGIPIRENPDLVQILLKLDLGQEIPPALYQAVAETLIFVYRLNEDWKRNHSS